MPAETPQLVLPFAEKEYIDPARCCRILGASWNTVRRLWDSGLIEVIDYRAGGWKKIRYQTVVEFCDRLREVHKLPNRRPTLSAPGLRHRDEDLLPFPIRDTMRAPDAMAALHLQSSRTLIKLIQEGRFEAYRLAEHAPWRIYRPSLETYIESLTAQRTGKYAYVRPATDREECEI